MAQEKGISRAALMIVITAGIASLLEVVDTSIVNVAIPTMMGNLGATLDDIGWVVTGYIISNAIVLPISGWLGTRFGRRRYYMTCITLFVISSVACGLSPNLDTLIFCRIVQGAAGGALLPTSQALIQEAFPGRAGLGSALYGMVVIIGPTVGPPLGGYLTDHFGWRSIFNINVPFGILALFLAGLYVKDYETKGVDAATHQKMRSAPVDTIGLSLLITGIGCLQYVLERGQADDWFSNSVILICSIMAAVTLPGFVWWELKIENPIMDLRLYKNFALINGTIMMATLGAMLYGLIFFVPIFATTIMGMDAGQTGDLFVPGAIAAGIMMPIMGSQLHKFDPRLFMLWGVSCVEVCLFLMTSWNPLTTYSDMFWPLMIRGFGMAGLFIPINAVVLGQFSGPALGQAAGIMNLSRQLGGSLGIAFLSTMFNRSQDVAFDSLRGHISPLNPGFVQWAQAARGAAYKFSSELGLYEPDSLVMKEAYFRVKKQAFGLSFEHMCWLMVIIFAFGLIPVYLLKKPQGMAAKPVDAH
ncbi:MAG TPA: DHA2 family efflux MFS transporter permease subunit [bacterium]|nr:DHA2 family efflux MFS transporter permease subunit [bacterium]